jgi:hypothetical protein
MGGPRMGGRYGIVPGALQVGATVLQR